MQQLNPLIMKYSITIQGTSVNGMMDQLSRLFKFTDSYPLLVIYADTNGIV